MFILFVIIFFEKIIFCKYFNEIEFYYCLVIKDEDLGINKIYKCGRGKFFEFYSKFGDVSFYKNFYYFIISRYNVDGFCLMS